MYDVTFLMFLGDFSEQQLVDCGFGKNGANGCDGAYTYAYIKYLADTGMDLLAEVRVIMI